MIAEHTLAPIGRVRSCWPEKFGIPKQPRLVDAATATIEFFPPYDREEMFRGLEDFSHIWVLFLFHGTIADGWKPTVRPPRLGGQKRVGVFASRSPHRPNYLGMSAVRLLGVREDNGSVRLEIGGVDLLDLTPVVDIKPYVPYADIIGDATSGFTDLPIPKVQVVFTDGASNFCREYQIQSGRDLARLVTETLASDPRPASQRTPGREFGAMFWEVNVRWRVVAEGFEVFSCARVTGRESPQ